MVYGISRVFTALNNNGRVDQNLNLPMINSVTNSFSSYLASENQIRAKRALMNQYKLRGELTGIVNKVVRDMVSDYEFIPMRKGKAGEKDVQTAMEFAEDNFLDKTLFSNGVDLLVTGDGFNHIGKISKSVAKGLARKALGKISNLETKEQDNLLKQIEYKIDEDALLVRELRSIPSSTVEVRYNQYEIENYVQRVNGRETVFNKDELIHLTLKEIDGKVNGFTPVSALLVQLDLLKEMWGNMSDIHKNGGTPDQFIIGKTLQPGSEAYKKMRDQLRNKKKFGNKHGSILLTGDVDIKNLQELDKMQFMDSGLYITGLIAMQWSVPRSSIPFIVGGTNTKDDTGGNSENDYWANIEHAQQLLSQIWNTQFFKKNFRVRIKFKRKYVQGEIRQESLRQQKLNNLKLTNDMLRASGKTLKSEKLIHEFGLSMDDVEDWEEPIEEVPGVSGTLNNQPSNAEVNDSQDKVNKNERKRQEQDATMASTGVPTGQGKELTFKQWDDNADKELLETKEVDVMVVDMPNFVKLYEEDKQMGNQFPRLFVRENEQNTTFMYKSTDFTYKTTLLAEELPNNRVAIMSLQGNMYRL